MAREHPEQSITNYVDVESGTKFIARYSPGKPPLFPADHLHRMPVISNCDSTVFRGLEADTCDCSNRKLSQWRGSPQSIVVKIVDGPSHLNGAKRAVITGVGLPTSCPKCRCASGCGFILLKTLVGARGFEPPTPCAQGRCATGLRYAPT
jgi:hypothetical protein